MFSIDGFHCIPYSQKFSQGLENDENKILPNLSPDILHIIFILLNLKKLKQRLQKINTPIHRAIMIFGIHENHQLISMSQEI